MKTILSITEAAKVVGIERSTLYRHIDEKNISVIKKEGSHPKIDVSELVRVYGDQVQPERLKKTPKQNKQQNSNDTNTTETQQNTFVSDKVGMLEKQLEREREMFNEQIEQQKLFVESLRKDLEDQKEQSKRVTLLLEHHTEKKETDNEWEGAIKALEKRIANQEQDAKRQREIAEKRLRIAKKLKADLAAEKNKTLWQKLFG